MTRPRPKPRVTARMIPFATRFILDRREGEEIKLYNAGTGRASLTETPCQLLGLQRFRNGNLEANALVSANGHVCWIL